MSFWDAQMLHSKGRLSLDRPLAAWLHQAAAPGVVALLPLATQDSAIQASGVIPIWEESA